MKSLDMQGRFPDWANYSAIACSSIFSCSAAGCKRSLTIAGGSTRLPRFFPSSSTSGTFNLTDSTVTARLQLTPVDAGNTATYIRDNWFEPAVVFESEIGAGSLFWGVEFSPDYPPPLNSSPAEQAKA